MTYIPWISCHAMLARIRCEEALEVFKTYTQLFPTRWNAYDSDGEALLKYGREEEAIKCIKNQSSYIPILQMAGRFWRK